MSMCANVWEYMHVYLCTYICLCVSEFVCVCLCVHLGVLVKHTVHMAESQEWGAE